MPWRYTLFVTPIEARWRVSVLDDVATIPERLCEVDDRQRALRVARSLAAKITAWGDEVEITEAA